MPDAVAEPVAEDAVEERYATAWTFYQAGDYLSARPLAVIAAAEGHAEAAKLAAVMYQNGLGGAADLVEAARWLRAAVLLNEDPDAMFQLGVMGRDERGDVTAVEGEAYLRRAADAGRIEALHELGLLYLEDRADIPRDEARARGLLQQAATAGAPEAQVDLALLLLEGRGGERDVDQALTWLGMAADAGDANGAYQLGVLLSDGNMVPVDDAEAARWFRVAADAGHGRAAAHLGVMSLLGIGQPESATEAVRRFEQAAASGDALGSYYFALMLAKGEGTDRDLEASYRWLLASQASGPLGLGQEESDRAALRDALEATLPAAVAERVRIDAGQSTNAPAQP